jgi:hypothetical protein
MRFPIKPNEVIDFSSADYAMSLRDTQHDAAMRSSFPAA